MDTGCTLFEKRLLLAAENCANTAEATGERSSLWTISVVSSSSAAISVIATGSDVIPRVAPKSTSDGINMPALSSMLLSSWSWLTSNEAMVSYSWTSIIDIPILARVTESITFDMTSSRVMLFSFPSSNAAANDTFGLSFDLPAPPTSGLRERIADNAVWWSFRLNVSVNKSNSIPPPVTITAGAT